ncbi:MAG: acyl-CoA dehydrogenase family protein [Sandaracinaceae bacterium]|nr:acyl-CoA dehydrogenase family protein [Sandaracinaceae bacterium]
MNFDLTSDQKMMKETAASFVKKSSPVERMRKLRDDARGWDPAIYKQMGELGWLGLPLPEAAGGLGGSMFDASLVLEQLGSTLVPEPFIPSIVLGGMAIAQAGNSEQQARFLAPVIEGDRSLALAYAERQSRYDLCDVATRADKSGDGWSLGGEKVFVLNGHAADHLVVAARTSGGQRDAQGISLFVIDRDAPGLTIRSIKTMDGARAASLELAGVKAGKDRLLGAEGEGLPVLEHVVDKAAAATCAEGVGIAQRVLWMTVEYLKTRKQFDVPIGVFQALQHRTVDMFVQVELLKSTSILACAKADSTDVAERQHAVSVAKARLASGGFHVVAQGTQLHGGIGVTDEHDISLYFKRMRVLNGLFGDEDFHVARFASLPRFTEGVS